MHVGSSVTPGEVPRVVRHNVTVLLTLAAVAQQWTSMKRWGVTWGIVKDGSLSGLYGPCSDERGCHQRSPWTTLY
jgi:hypothetical protein